MTFWQLRAVALWQFDNPITSHLMEDAREAKFVTSERRSKYKRRWTSQIRLWTRLVPVPVPVAVAILTFWRLNGRNNQRDRSPLAEVHWRKSIGGSHWSWTSTTNTGLIDWISRPVYLIERTPWLLRGRRIHRGPRILSICDYLWLFAIICDCLRLFAIVFDWI